MTEDEMRLLAYMGTAEKLAVETDFRLAELMGDETAMFVNDTHQALIHFGTHAPESVSIADRKTGSIRAELDLVKLQAAADPMLIALLRHFAVEEPF